MFYFNFILILIIGSGRALIGAFLRLVYSGPVPSKPIMDLSLNEVRVGFMDLVLDAAAGLERRLPRNFIQGVKYRRFRKYF